MTTPVAGGWTPHDGGEMPSDLKGVMVEVMLRDGDIERGVNISPWPHENASDGIVAYRIVPDVPALTDREGEASYRLLRRTEKIEPGDQPLNDDCKTWGDLVGWEIGAPYNPLLMVPVRRALLNGADR